MDIDAGNALVKRIGAAAKATARAGTESGLGGFGALFDLKAAGFRDPILVATTDGVGTKLKVAIAADQHGTVGIDLVAMCVNDLVVQGAEPLLFLDYVATSALDVDVTATVIEGIAAGCMQAGCALVGGETAEMPGMYSAGDYDLAGFAVGAAERGMLIDGSTIVPGDVVLGLASSGPHANGYSLVRAVVQRSGLDWAAPAPFDSGQTLAEALLTPTRIYVKPCLAAVRAGVVKGMAHITGGGLVENLPRVLPPRTQAVLYAGVWPQPPVFGWLAEVGNVSSTEMARTFNLGVGMAVVVAEEDVEKASTLLTEAGETVHVIGKIVEDNSDTPSCLLQGA